MYSVLRYPQHPIHVPADSELYSVITQQIPQTMPDGEPITIQAQIDELDLPGPSSGTAFLGMNLLCSATQAGDPNAQLGDKVATANGEGVQLTYPVDCGDSVPDRIPYYVFAVLMFGTTFFQQRQMQKASPPGASSPQQQALLKVMPIMFGVFGVFFPAGLVVYWTTSNAWQIGQQYFMLKTRPTADQMAADANSKTKSNGGSPKGKRGLMASMMERGEQQRARREAQQGKSGNPKPGAAKKKPGSGPDNPGSGGGSDGGDPKKRPKR